MRAWIAVGLVVVLAVVSPAAAQQSGIRDAIRSAVVSVRRCYERSIARGENPRPGYSVEIHIEVSGRVSFASFRGAERDAPYLARCVSHAFKRTRFPPQSSRIVIRYPLNVDPVY